LKTNKLIALRGEEIDDFMGKLYILTTYVTPILLHNKSPMTDF